MIIFPISYTEGQMKNKFKHQELFLIALIFLLSMTSFITPHNSTPIMVDKELIIDPLLNVSNIMDYGKLFTEGKLYDVQPIRDLSHLSDIWLTKITSYEQIPLLQNILILLVTCFFLFQFLNMFFNQNISLFLTLIFLAHPSTFNIYVEFTSRKHILSFLFFLISINTFNKEAIEEKKYYWKSYFWFSISILCHPINSFTFITNAIILKYIHKKTYRESFFRTLPFAIIFLILVGFNLYYYKVLHVSKNEVIDIKYSFNISNIIYGMSLHYKSYFFPAYFARFYQFFNLSNLITIVLLPLLYLVTFKKDKVLTIISGSITFSIFFALYGHNSNILNVLYQNYYGLTSGLACSLLFGILIKKSFNLHYYLLFIPILLLSNFYGNIRTDQYNYLRSSVKIEPECRLIQGVISLAILKKDIPVLRDLGPDYINQRCRLVGFNVNDKHVYINTMLIFISDDFSFNQKVELFTKKFPNIEDKTLLLASLEFQKNRKSKYFYELLLNLKEAKYHSIFLNNTFIGPEFIKACKDDNNIACQSFNQYNDKFKSQDIFMKWNRKINLEKK
jgi:hypothetical protein